MFLGRWSMVQGWTDLVRSRFHRGNEFVSADARRLSSDPRTYEMLSGTGLQLNITSPGRALTSPAPRSAFDPDPDLKQGYVGPARAYVNPASSYSYPRPPSQPKDWDPTSTHAGAGKGYDMKIYPR